MKRGLIIIAIIVVAGGIYLVKEYFRKNKDLATTKADVNISASALINDFETNMESANDKYLGKIIAVTGDVKSIETDPNPATIILGDAESMASVRCSMDTTYINQVRSLTEGQTITVKGNCTGFNQDDLLGSDVILNRCVIQK